MTSILNESIKCYLRESMGTPEEREEYQAVLESVSPEEYIRQAHNVVLEEEYALPRLNNVLQEKNFTLESVQEALKNLEIAKLEVRNIQTVEASRYRLNLDRTKIALESAITTEAFFNSLKKEYDEKQEYALEAGLFNNGLTREDLEDVFALELTELINMDRWDPTIVTESLNKLNGIALRYIHMVDLEPVTEAFEKVKKKSQNVKKKVDEVDKKELARKGKEAAKKGGAAVAKGAEETGKAIGKLPMAVERLIDSTFGKLGRMNRDVRQRAMLNGGYLSKMMRLLKHLIIGLGVKYAIGGVIMGPVLGILAMVVSAALDKRASGKVRENLTKDMEQELKVVEEKIRDADVKGDRQAKYQLIRIKDALERDINRIKFAQENKTYRASSVKEG